MTHNGITYQQIDTRTLERKEDPCYWCVAYRNMPLCDALCPACETDHVFIRSPK